MEYERTQKDEDKKMIKTNNKYINLTNIKLTTKEFKKLGSFITQVSGIKLPPAKKVLLESRLQKRLRKLNITSFGGYFEYLFSSEGLGKELIHLLDVVTTNKTDFFREPEHFDFMSEVAIPEIMKQKEKTSNSEILIWSAASSTGEEPYTLAMVMELQRKYINNLKYKIIGTDLSTKVLDKAKTAVYAEERVENFSYNMKKQFLLRSKDRKKKLVRIIPELRKKIFFSRLNLLDDKYNIPKKVDIIFCRNVFIYFEKEMQENIVRKFYNYLNPNGYLFVGHSESLNGMDVPFKQVIPTVYKNM